MRHVIRWCFAVATSLLILTGVALAEPQSTEISFHSSTKVRFASAEEAAALLGKADPWVTSLSGFDRSARIGQVDDPGEPIFSRIFIQVDGRQNSNGGRDE